MGKYNSRLQRVIDSSEDGLNVKLASIMDEEYLPAFVSNHENFNGTIFTKTPFELSKLSEVSLARINISDYFLIFDAIISFPIISEESILPKFDVSQVGFMVSDGKSNDTICVKHILPKQVMAFEGKYFDLETCGGSYPFGICRVDLADLQDHLSCFKGQLVSSCPQYPVKCDSLNYVDLKSGILFTTNLTVFRSTYENEIVTVNPADYSATYITWNNTRSVHIGKKIHFAPNSNTCSGSGNFSCSSEDVNVYDVDLHYQQEDVHLLHNYKEEEYAEDMSRQEHKIVLMMAKQRHFFHESSSNLNHENRGGNLNKEGIMSYGGIAGIIACSYLLLNCFFRSKLAHIIFGTVTPTNEQSNGTSV